ncbi:hypothetical protein GGP66_002854 [Salinibacter ruber]|jgi:hypothetical protein|nr:hypothetical protein [Salinibacter ruber]
MWVLRVWYQELWGIIPFSLVFSTSSFSAAYPFQRLIFHVSGPFAPAVLNPGATRRKRPVGEKAYLREDPLVREKAEALL